VSPRDALSDSIDEYFGFGEDDASKQSRADMVIVGVLDNYIWDSTL
jgi:hypothetical protein